MTESRAAVERSPEMVELGGGVRRASQLVDQLLRIARLDGAIESRDGFAARRSGIARQRFDFTED